MIGSKRALTHRVIVNSTMQYGHGVVRPESLPVWREDRADPPRVGDIVEVMIDAATGRTVFVRWGVTRIPRVARRRAEA